MVDGFDRARGLPERSSPLVDAVAAWRRHGATDAPLEIRTRLVEGTIPGACRSAVRLAAGRPALRIDGEAATHEELDQRAARAATVLQRAGVAQRERVLLYGPNSIDLVVAYLAVLRLGAAAVFISPSVTPFELRSLLADSGATSLIAAETTAPMHEAVVSLPVEARLRLEEISRLGAGTPEVREVAAGPDDVAVLAYTSGTTGVPKGVPLTHANLLSSVRGALGAWEWSPEDVLLHALPLAHQHGLSGVHASLVSGSMTVVLSRFDPAVLASEARCCAATVLFGVPTVYERLIESDRVTTADFGSLRLVVSGSAPLPERLFDRISETFGQEPLERYGTTESGLDVSNLYRGPRRAGRVGLPLPGVEMALVDASGGQCVAGTSGEIVVSGPQVFDGYWNRLEETETAFLSGGWFRTGDIGVVDPGDGHLQITGRSKELIISGGLNVYPREVERALEEHPSVRRAAVVGMPSTRWGEEVWALVVTGGAPLDSTFDAHVRNRLAAYKRPKRVIVVDDLPQTSVGKLARGQLRDLAAELASHTGPGQPRAQ